MRALVGIIAAARCGLMMAESREVLDRLVSQGTAELLVAPDGTMVDAISGPADAAGQGRRDRRHVGVTFRIQLERGSLEC